jgi:hypothetical protein
MQLHPHLYICILVLAVLLQACDSNKKTDLIKAQEEGDPILTAKVDYLNSLLDSIESSLREKNYAEAERVSLELTKVIAEIGMENEGMLQQSLLESLGETSSEIVLEETNSEIIEKAENNAPASGQINEDQPIAHEEDAENRLNSESVELIQLDNIDEDSNRADDQNPSFTTEVSENESLVDSNPIKTSSDDKYNENISLVDKKTNISDHEEKNYKPSTKSEPQPIQQTQKYKIGLRVFPKIKNDSKDRYYVEEQISLNVKIENKDLNNPCENIKIKYYLIGKDLKSKKEYILIGSGEEEIELGSSFSDRKEEIDTNAHINRYSKNTSSKSFKYDSWALAIVARDGQVIKYETSPSIKIDYNKVDAMESRRIYDQSLSPISGIYRSSSGGVFY